MKLVTLLFFLLSINAYGYELIAHRGIYQTYNRVGINNETCTATRIYHSKHEFLENTLDSIEEAFRLGASMVEVDVHPTTESNIPEKLAVFHDWTLDCRTNASCDQGCDCNAEKQCLTHEQSWDYLSKLDLGHGYTFDDDKTYPFRGSHFGKMSEFEDILDLLKRYPSKKILVNVKGNTLRTAKVFTRIIESYPVAIRKRIYYPFKYGLENKLKLLGVEDHIDQKAKKCLLKYLQVGWLGIFPEECHGRRIFIPIRETLERVIGKVGRHVMFTQMLWGWPEKFIQLAHQNGAQIYASQVDSPELYQQMKELNLDGIMTNNIELIGPIHQK